MTAGTALRKTRIRNALIFIARYARKNIGGVRDAKIILDQSMNVLGGNRMKKLIKKLKVFPTGSCYVELNKGIDTKEGWEQYNRELDMIGGD